MNIYAAHCEECHQYYDADLPECPLCILQKENSRLREKLQSLIVECEELLPELACRCDECYTSRGKHEVNSLCYCFESLDIALNKAKN